MFQGSHVAYYHGDKEVPQVKIGACDKHLPNLKGLWMVTRSENKVSERVCNLCAVYLMEDALA